MIRSLSIVIKGKEEGLDPVAIIIFLASMVWVVHIFSYLNLVCSCKTSYPLVGVNFVFVH